MFTSLLLGFHILVCLVLIIVVLLQAGKGSSMGLSLGGGASQTVFGSSGGKNFFARLTTGLAVVFMLTSILLSIFSSRAAQTYRGIMRQLPDASQSESPAKAPAEVPAQK